MGIFRMIPWWGYLIVLIPLIIVVKTTGSDASSGRVVGIVGRMGSGKSYMATRIAYRRMLRGAKIVTNFSMFLQCPEKGHRRRHCPCTMADQWQRFNDWPDLLTLQNAVVIIDEADLFAPSHDYHAITDEVRWKMKMARKHRLDIYWITQHENRVNRILRDVLTNEIAVCQSWFGGMYFTAKFYDPTSVRRRKAHVARTGYFLRKKIAGLYDTLETIRGSEYAGDDTMAKVNELAQNFEDRRLETKNRIKINNRKRVKPCEHERRKKVRAGSCQECHPNLRIVEDSGVLEAEEVAVG